MARDLNKVQLTGRLGADPTLRYTTQGSALVTFRVASNRTWRSAAGVSHEDTEWFRVVAWDQLAEQCRGQLGRGDHIYVEGRLQTRQWVEANGQQRISTEVIASEVIVLGATRLADAQGAAGAARHADAKGASPPSPTPPADRSPPAPETTTGRPSHRSRRVRPAAPPPDLAHPTPPPTISLAEEDLPI